MDEDDLHSGLLDAFNRLHDDRILSSCPYFVHTDCSTVAMERSHVAVTHYVRRAASLQDHSGRS
jgi:hypothetical protein